jgi:hypothetical protein
MPRSTGSEALRQVVDQYARRLGATLERFITGRIDKEASIARKRGRGRRRRAPVRCYYPGCKNIAAPRFGMFCAKLHKGLSKADKAKYRAAHLKKK